MLQPRVTIVVTVSRDFLLPKLYASLELMSCDRRRTDLLTIVDGDAELFLHARNLTNESKFEQRLCVRYEPDKKIQQMKYNTTMRRKRISDIKNQTKQYMWDSEFVMGIEDDTIPPTNALTKLLKGYRTHPYAGFIEGLELGRWGIPYIGAWNVDSIYEPKDIQSIGGPNESQENPLVEIDAGGFYCYLTKHENYIMHDYKPWSAGKLGPDVEFGISMRLRGLKNYIDTSLVCDHYDQKGNKINPKNSPVTTVRMMNDKKKGWRFY